MKIDFGMQVVFILLAIFKVILTSTKNQSVYGVVGSLIWQLVVIIILFGIIRRIRNANAEPSECVIVSNDDMESKKTDTGIEMSSQ